MRLFVIFNFLIAILHSCLAAPQNLEGQIKGYTKGGATEGPPLFTKIPIPNKRPGQSRANYAGMIDFAHGLIINKEHPDHVEGVVMTHTPFAGSEALENPASHYGVEVTDPTRPTYIIKKPVRFAIKNGIPDRPDSIISASLTQENFDKLKADLCKRGLAASCLVQPEKKSAIDKQTIRRPMKLQPKKKTPIKQAVLPHIHSVVRKMRREKRGRG